jgi:hypothetical protein
MTAPPPPHQAINTAFQLLVGTAPSADDPAPAAGGAGVLARATSSSPRPEGAPRVPDPLGAVVALVRALWEYMHVHALCRKLSKPFKVACALRNVLLLGDVPLYARWADDQWAAVYTGQLAWRSRSPLLSQAAS